MIILVVDDNAVMLLSVEAMLKRAGHRPIVASGPLAVLEKPRAFDGEIDLPLTDVTMPEMDGFRLAREIVKARPQIRALLMSAHTGLPSRLRF